MEETGLYSVRMVIVQEYESPLKCNQFDIHAA